MESESEGCQDNRLAELLAEVGALRGEVKKLAAALSASNARESSWRGIMSRLPGVVYLLDSSGLMTFTAGSGAVPGWLSAGAVSSPDEWRGRIVPEDLPAYRAFCLASGEGTGETEYRLSSGAGTLWVRDIRSFLSSNGEDGVVACGFIFDISALKNAGAQDSRSALPGMPGASSELTGMIIHDLKNPLTLIALAAESFAAGSFGKLNDTQLRYAELVRVSASRQQMLLSNLLEISRLEDGSQSVSPGEMEISELMPELGWVADYARLEGKKLSIDFPEGTLICADRMLLARVLSNLMVNALKRTPSGGTVSVRAETGSDVVTITVADQGEALDERHAADIFERSFMAEGGARLSAGLNTGLGLTFCKLALVSFGGAIRAENGQGGVVFHILLRRVCPA